MVGGGESTCKGFWVARRKMAENSGEMIKVGMRGREDGSQKCST